MLDSNLSTTEDLQCNGHLLAAEVDQPRYSHNELEQYRRRNSLRINNFVLDTPVENEHELTRCVLYFLNFLYTAGLKGVCRVLDERDIERCHFVGKPKDSGPQKILIKFSCYHDKWRVFSLKKNLKKHPNKTFITEDLTSMNLSVVQTLLPLKRGGKIDSFWTRDGRIIVKKTKSADPIRIGTSDNINFSLGIKSTGDDDDEAEPMNEEPAESTNF